IGIILQLCLSESYMKILLKNPKKDKDINHPNQEESKKKINSKNKFKGQYNPVIRMIDPLKEESQKKKSVEEEEEYSYEDEREEKFFHQLWKDQAERRKLVTKRGDGAPTELHKSPNLFVFYQWEYPVDCKKPPESFKSCIDGEVFCTMVPYKEYFDSEPIWKDQMCIHKDNKRNALDCCGYSEHTGEDGKDASVSEITVPRNFDLCPIGYVCEKRFGLYALLEPNRYFCLRQIGLRCNYDFECEAGSCVEHACIIPSSEEGTECYKDSQCYIKKGLICKNKKCTKVKGIITTGLRDDFPQKRYQHLIYDLEYECRKGFFPRNQMCVQNEPLEYIDRSSRTMAPHEYDKWDDWDEWDPKEPKPEPLPLSLVDSKEYWPHFCEESTQSRQNKDHMTCLYCSDYKFLKSDDNKLKYQNMCVIFREAEPEGICGINYDKSPNVKNPKPIVERYYIEIGVKHPEYKKDYFKLCPKGYLCSQDLRESMYVNKNKLFFKCKKDIGEYCEKDEECAHNYCSKTQNKCKRPTNALNARCIRDEQCGSLLYGNYCKNGRCIHLRDTFKREPFDMNLVKDTFKKKFLSKEERRRQKEKELEERVRESIKEEQERRKEKKEEEEDLKEENKIIEDSLNVPLKKENLPSNEKYFKDTSLKENEAEEERKESSLNPPPFNPKLSHRIKEENTKTEEEKINSKENKKSIKNSKDVSDFLKTEKEKEKEESEDDSSSSGYNIEALEKQFHESFLRNQKEENKNINTPFSKKSEEELRDKENTLKGKSNRNIPSVLKNTFKESQKELLSSKKEDSYDSESESGYDVEAMDKRFEEEIKKELNEGKEKSEESKTNLRILEATKKMHVH
ncbi:MAG: dickkopf-related protein, partial [archaeon]|nr:dickkopf-related protein [archaeon]